jgi:hypothetical protein
VTADQVPRTDPRDCPRFLAQPLRRLRRVIFYQNTSLLHCIKQVSRAGRSTGRSSSSEGSRLAKRDRFTLGSRIGGIGSSICNQTTEIVADRPAHQSLLLPFQECTIFESWSDQLSQRDADPRSLARIFQMMLLRASP